MGGTVAMIIREPDGKEHRMARWTNNIPYFVMSDRFFEFDKDHFGIYQSWMNGDMEEYAQLSPISYGLIVCDFQSKTLLSNQGYTDLKSISSISMRIESRDGKFDPADTSRYSAFKRMFEKGMIKKFDYYIYDRDNRSYENGVLDVSDFSIEKNQ